MLFNLAIIDIIFLSHFLKYIIVQANNSINFQYFTIQDHENIVEKLLYNPK